MRGSASGTRASARARGRGEGGRSGGARASEAERRPSRRRDGIPALVRLGRGSRLWPTGPIVMPPIAPAADRRSVRGERVRARLLLAAAVLLAPGRRGSAETVDQIVARHLAARGGREALAAVSTVRMTGHATPGPAARDRAARDRAARAASAPSSCSRGRPASTSGTARPAGACRRSTAASSPSRSRTRRPPCPPSRPTSTARSSTGRPRATGSSSSATTTLPGGAAHELKVTLKSGAARHVWLDAATGLVVRTLRCARCAGTRSRSRRSTATTARRAASLRALDRERRAGAGRDGCASWSTAWR